MKLLTQNYSSHYTTEPFYLTECFKRVGVDAHLWADSNVSAFDMFDTVNPDVFVGHFAYLTEDVVKYLSQNKNIKPVINVTGTNQQQLKGITDTFMSMGLESPILFSNNFVHSHGDAFNKILLAGANEEWADFTVDIRNFWGISACYDEVTLIDDGMISTSQFFFQATMMCNKINITSQTEEQREAFQEILSSLFTSEETSENVGSVVKI